MGCRTDGELNDAGIRQAQELAERLTKDFDVIFSSDLKRAAQTAEIVSTKLGIPVVFREELRERDFGSLSGKHWDEVYEKTGVNSGDKDSVLKYDHRPFGGDSVEDIKERLLEFIDDVKKNYSDKKILVVTHGGILRLMHAMFSQDEIAELGNASIHEFEL